jgi:AcrR family transcriptional regulator
MSDSTRSDSTRSDSTRSDSTQPDSTRSDSTQQKRPRADAERNRLRLLDVAQAAFSSGQDAVTLEQIARDAGVGIGTLYRHFPTREALVEAVYRKELEALCASAAGLLATLPPERALRAWMDRFADYVTAKREMADALRAVYASGAVSVPEVRLELSAAVRVIMNAGAADGTLRRDVRPDDVVAMTVGVFTATSIAGGREQLERMLDLLADAVRQPAARPAGPEPAT